MKPSKPVNAMSDGECAAPRTRTLAFICFAWRRTSTMSASVAGSKTTPGVAAKVLAQLATRTPRRPGSRRAMEGVQRAGSEG